MYIYMHIYKWNLNINKSATQENPPHLGCPPRACSDSNSFASALFLSFSARGDDVLTMLAHFIVLRLKKIWPCCWRNTAWLSAGTTARAGNIRNVLRANGLYMTVSSRVEGFHKTPSCLGAAGRNCCLSFASPPPSPVQRSVQVAWADHHACLRCHCRLHRCCPQEKTESTETHLLG